MTVNCAFPGSEDRGERQEGPSESFRIEETKIGEAPACLSERMVRPVRELAAEEGASEACGRSWTKLRRFQVPRHLHFARAEVERINQR